MKQFIEMLDMFLLRIMYLEKLKYEFYEGEALDLRSCFLKFKECVEQLLLKETIQDVAGFNYDEALNFIKGIGKKVKVVSVKTYKVPVYNIDRLSKSMRNFMFVYTTADYFLGYNSEQQVLDQLKESLRVMKDELEMLINYFDPEYKPELDVKVKAKER